MQGVRFLLSLPVEDQDFKVVDEEQRRQGELVCLYTEEESLRVYISGEAELFKRAPSCLAIYIKK